MYTDDYSNQQIEEIWGSETKGSSDAGKGPEGNDCASFALKQEENGTRDMALDTNSRLTYEIGLNTEAHAHIRVYALAEYFQMEDLKSLAIAKYKNTDLDYSGFLDVMDSVYRTTTRADDPFRRLVCAQAVKHCPSLVVDETRKIGNASGSERVVGFWDAMVNHQATLMKQMQEIKRNHEEKLENMSMVISNRLKIVQDAITEHKCSVVAKMEKLELYYDDSCGLDEAAGIRARCNRCGRDIL